jgi:sec-independent protein translocase protein TatA
MDRIDIGDTKMGAMSIWHWAIVAGVVCLLFGRNVFSNTMADLGKGLKQLKKINQDDEA